MGAAQRVGGAAGVALDALVPYRTSTSLPTPLTAAAPRASDLCAWPWRWVRGSTWWAGSVRGVARHRAPNPPHAPCRAGGPGCPAPTAAVAAEARSHGRPCRGHPAAHSLPAAGPAGPQRGSSAWPAVLSAAAGPVRWRRATLHAGAPSSSSTPGTRERKGECESGAGPGLRVMVHPPPPPPPDPRCTGPQFPQCAALFFPVIPRAQSPGPHHPRSTAPPRFPGAPGSRSPVSPVTPVHEPKFSRYRSNNSF